MAASTRALSRSPRKIQLISATVAGMPAITTPAANAEVACTPNSMQIENRKFPKKLPRNNTRRSAASSGGSSLGLGVQVAMAKAAMPKRRPANKKTGNTSTRDFDKPT